ncbi:hypothetical protein HUU53_02325 [Candidatus Micrarchaeota archaeon]|nr:hypothetical protein [Candidatus Micrarchaeota archaeon]
MDLAKYKNWILYAIAGLFLALYLLTNQEFFGVLVFFALLALIVLDFSPKKEGDWKTTLKELVIALVFAGAAWFLLGFLLNTSSPLNVVTSCSMLPELQRGDLIFLKGDPIQAPEVTTQLSRSELSQSIKLVKNRCFIGTNPDLCTSSILFDGQEFSSKPSNNSIIVFEPEPNNIGLIIHRAMLKINTPDGAYYLTKGDNNQVLDQEASFDFVDEKKILGNVFFRIPFIGYVKLLLFLQFQVPPGCDRTITYT